MKKVLVIGGSGFVGRNIQLDISNFDTHSLDLLKPSAPNELYKSHLECDILTKSGQSAVLALKPDVIVLLAGRQFLSPIQKRKHRHSSFSINEKIAESVISIVSQMETSVRVIYVSTDMVYGLPQNQKISEDTQPKPIGEYGKSKLRAENILKVLGDRSVIIRPRLIVGPGRSGTVKLLSRFMYSKFPVPIIGRGDNRYQMIAVEDIWSAIELLIKTNASGIYNVGTKNPPVLNELLPQVFSNLGLKKRIIRIPTRVAESILLLLDFVNLSPLAPEQFLIASKNCLLNTSKLEKLGWKSTKTDQEILTSTLSSLRPSSRDQLRDQP